MAEDVTTAAAIVAAGLGVAKPVVETGCRLIENLLGRPAKVAGNLLADEVYAWQWANRVRIASRARAIMDRSNVAARVVPKGFLLPLVEAAGNVDEPDLQELWAHLLASGVAEDKCRHPMFVDVLRRMNGDDAGLLLEMAKWAAEPYSNPMTPEESLPFQMASDESARLESLGLIAPILRPTLDAPRHPWSYVIRIGGPNLQISEFGWQFLAAVAPDVARRAASK